jgi:hypothetical protein
MAVRLLGMLLRRSIRDTGSKAGVRPSAIVLLAQEQILRGELGT